MKATPYSLAQSSLREHKLSFSWSKGKSMIRKPGIILLSTTGKVNFLKWMLSTFLLFSTLANAEDFEVQLTPSLYAGGYNISCHGANTGSISLFISGGNAPYTYVWLDGPIIRNRTNLTAGYYRVVVTSSNGSTVIREITLKEPGPFQAILHPSEYEGGNNITENGGSNGEVEAEVLGGVPPYTYLWSNGSANQAIENLTAGIYTVTVHDATNCVASSGITLLEPTVFHLVSISSPFINNSLYNASGCAKQNGSVNLTVAGGTPPYKYRWSNGAFTQNISNLAEGDYSVIIGDANGTEVTAGITLAGSPKVEALLTAFIYPNGKNTSCRACSNGSISISNLAGVAPYTFSWNNGQVTQNPSSLAAGDYTVNITDAVGCTLEKELSLIAPEREDWTMSGNTLTNPVTHYIGTSDNNDLVFKANSTERVRLLSGGGTQFTGDVKLSNSPGMAGMLFMDSSGKLINSEVGAQIPVCNRSGLPIWNTTGINNSIYSCSPTKVGIGISSFPNSVIFRVNGSSLFEGDMEIGSTTNNYQLLVNGQAKITSLGSNGSASLVQADANGLLSPIDFPTPASMNYWQLHTNGTDVYRPSGKIGIGNNNPVSLLDISGSTAETGELFRVNKQIDAATVKNLLSLSGNGEFRIGCDGITEPWQPTVYISPVLSGDNYLAAKVGISTDAPSGQFQVGHRIEKVVLGSFYSNDPWYNGSYVGFNAGRDRSTAQWTIDNDGTNKGASVIAGGVGGELRFISFDGSLPGEHEPTDSSVATILTDTQILEQIKMVVRPDGKIGIGQPANYNGNFRLYVKGGILSDRIKVAADGSPEWMDIVFDKEYKLRSLKDLESYIACHKHLPEIPTTAEVKQEGIDLGMMQKKSLQKIEELTLYIIQQNNRIEKLEKLIK